MRFVKTDELKPGMVSIKNIYNENNVKLLGKNTPLTSIIIEKMKQIGYEGIFIYDQYSDFEEITEIIDESQRMKMLSALKTLNIDKIVYFSGEIVDALLEQTDICLDFNELRNYHNSTYEHSINVAMLSVSCGIGLGLNNYQLNELALSAMLHDIGKECIPLEILDKPDKLNEAEREIINYHPQFGYDMLKDNTNITSTVRVSVLEHHENYDGTGYPRGLKGDEIYLYARIIHVADVYDALCSKRSYKKDYDPAESIEYLMSNCGTMFDVDIVSTFLKYVVVYPVGINVKLSNGEVAHVIKNRSQYVLRPVVVTSSGKVIDLAKDSRYYSVTIIKSNY